MDSVWVFNGVQSQFPNGVFGTKEVAERWIKNNHLTGTLTQYPLNVGMYEYAIHNKLFTPEKPEHSTALFIGKFSGGGIDHCHYEDGVEG